MSHYDDQLAEVEARLERAWAKCRYGRKYSPAYDVALRIKVIRRILKGENDEVRRSFVRAKNHLWQLPKRITASSSDELDVETPDYVARNYIWPTAASLLFGAIKSSRKLREIADALDAEKNEDGRQASILKAYDECRQTVAYPPTLAELETTFRRRFGGNCWPKDFAVRKTLRVLGLPLRKDKRGPKVGSRQSIRNRKG